MSPCTAKELTSNATTILKEGRGHLSKIVVNMPGSGSIRVFDGTDSDGTAIVGGAGAVALPAAGTALAYDCEFYNGLCVITSGMTAGSVTVVFS